MVFCALLACRAACIVTAVAVMVVVARQVPSYQGDVTLCLFFDVKGAFLSAVIPHLIHDMHTQGILPKYTAWLCKNLANHSTTINFDDYKSPPLAIFNKIDQGCPLQSFYTLSITQAFSTLPWTQNRNSQLASRTMSC